MLIRIWYNYAAPAPRGAAFRGLGPFCSAGSGPPADRSAHDDDHPDDEDGDGRSWDLRGHQLIKLESAHIE